MVDEAWIEVSMKGIQYYQKIIVNIKTLGLGLFRLNVKFYVLKLREII